MNNIPYYSIFWICLPDKKKFFIELPAYWQIVKKDQQEDVCHDSFLYEHIFVEHFYNVTEWYLITLLFIEHSFDSPASA
jgi:hypothetical protein